MLQKGTLHGNPYFIFPDVLKRWSFQENSAGIWSFLCYWEGWYFFFPKIWSYTLDGKWKMIFLKKHTDIWCFLQAHDLSCIIWKDGIFSQKHDLFSRGRKWKTALPRKYMETWCIAQQRKTGNLMYRIEAWLLLKFIRLEIFLQWIILNTLYHSSLRGCAWGCAWAPIREIICPLGDRL